MGRQMMLNFKAVKISLHFDRPLINSFEKYLCRVPYMLGTVVVLRDTTVNKVLRHYIILKEVTPTFNLLKISHLD